MLGKPLIMAKNTGMDGIVKGNNIGVLIEYNVESLKKELLGLVNRRDEWIDMGDRMKYLYKSKYSWDEMERRLIEIYNYEEGD